MPNLIPDVQNQIQQCVIVLENILKKDLLSIYLYGSAMIGGLQKYSDIDLFVISKRTTTSEEKIQIIKNFLQISGRYMKEEKLPIELTIVNISEINPWKYPTKFDFQYGEWLRDNFEKGEVEPWSTKIMPDLAILITKVLLASKTLFGFPPEKLLCPIPHQDFILATADAINNLENELFSDTRNVLLTYARIWYTLENDALSSKQIAARWALAQIPSDLQAPLKRAIHSLIS